MPTNDELKILQALPLEMKIRKSKQRIKEWVNHYGEDNVYVAFSGGKDSTVLLHLVRSLYPNVKAVFSDTGLEFPEIRNFVKTFENVDFVKPKQTFRDITIECGYPLFSKEIAETIRYARKISNGGGYKSTEYFSERLSDNRGGRKTTTSETNYYSNERKAKETARCF